MARHQPATVVPVFLVLFWGLTGATPKKTLALLGTFAAISLCGVWVGRFVLTVPSLWQEAPVLPLGWQDLLVTLGFLGAWGLAYTWLVRRFPIVSPHLNGQDGSRADGRALGAYDKRHTSDGVRRGGYEGAATSRPRGASGYARGK